MKTYRVKVSPEAKEALNRYKNYLRDAKYSSQAAKTLFLISVYDWKIDLKINESTELELFIMKNKPPRVTNPEAYGLRHLAFKVESVADTVAELEGKGIPCEPIRTDSYTGKAMTFFKDPDGLPIEIHE